jgi:Nif-specific regulatory protein
LRGARDSVEKEQIRSALTACAGNQTRAAEMLGLSRSGLIKKLARFGIKRPRGGSDSE